MSATRFTNACLPLRPEDLPDPEERRAYVEAVMRGELDGRWPEDWDGDTGLTLVEQEEYLRSLDWSDRSWENDPNADIYPIEFYGERASRADYAAFVKEHAALLPHRSVNSGSSVSMVIHSDARGISRAMIRSAGGPSATVWLDRDWERSLELAAEPPAPRR